MKNIIRKLWLLLEGKLPDYNDYLELRAKRLDDGRHIAELEKRIEQYCRLVKVAGFDDLSHEPTGKKEREQYAGRVAEFHQDILGVKLRTSVAEIREMLAAVGRPPELHHMTREQYDFFLRGMEAGMWKIHDWATLLEGELKNK